MDDHFVHKVSRLFPSSFTSCQFRTVPDIVDSSISITKILHHESNVSSSYANLQENHFLIQPQDPKIPKNHVKKSPKCPPVTPVSVLASEQSMKKKKPIKESFNKNIKFNHTSSSNYSGWFSSDGVSDAFFSISSDSSEYFRLKTASSSRRFDYKTTEIGRCSSGISAKAILSQSSLESNKNPPRKHRKNARNSTQFVTEDEIFKGSEVFESSTELYYGNCKSTNPLKTARKTGENNRRRRNGPPPGTGGGGGENDNDDKLEESYSVEKSSDDPQSDFRKSMVELIIEKQIFGAKELERMLYCFLSLNSPHYHKIILEVFNEICDTLFSTPSISKYKTFT